jgi:hypothetical protein
MMPLLLLLLLLEELLVVLVTLKEQNCEARGKPPQGATVKLQLSKLLKLELV